MCWRIRGKIWIFGHCLSLPVVGESYSLLQAAGRTPASLFSRWGFGFTNSVLKHFFFIKMQSLFNVTESKKGGGVVASHADVLWLHAVLAPQQERVTKPNPRGVGETL